MIRTIIAFALTAVPAFASDVFRAGAASVDITPPTFPVIVNGMFTSRSAAKAHDILQSRAIVLDDGSTRIALVVVDNLMIKRDLLDTAKQAAADSTGIPTTHMMISSTHTHSAPSAMGCLGTDIDPGYAKFLPGQITKSIIQANENLTPARIGWGVRKVYEHNHVRRWIHRSDKHDWTGGVDPFGNQTVKANMHPGYQNKNVIGPSGPADPDLSMLAVQTKTGKPIAVLGNYAMHYFGAPLISGDFCGRFGKVFAKKIDALDQEPRFVGAMSQGTSGDSMWMDFGKPKSNLNLTTYTEAMATHAKALYESIEFKDWVPLKMAEQAITLKRRVPDESRLAWARKTMQAVGDRLPKNRGEIYAREAIYLHEEPEVEIKLQGIRIGDLGIATFPNEVYGITGLKIKAHSPQAHTFNIELANGAQGYIPTPEQHYLGGYSTWPARTAGLETSAEPKIVAKLLQLLEVTSGKRRVKRSVPEDDHIRAIVDSKPIAFWRMDELAGTLALDSAGNNHHGEYTLGVAFHLPGRGSDKHEIEERTPNRAAHFAGGFLTANVGKLESDYSVSLWFWNGFPADVRPVVGEIVHIGSNADQLLLTRHPDGKARVTFANGSGTQFVGAKPITEKTWHHVLISRKGSDVNVYVDGDQQPDITAVAEQRDQDASRLSIGGSDLGTVPFEGRIDEVAVYDRALTAAEVAKLHPTATSGQKRTARPQAESPPMTPLESLKRLNLRDGYEIDLVAAEPLVEDPVAIDWGLDGKLWVVEMADYPYGIAGKAKGGRVRVLEDTNGDGRYDKSTVFIEDLPFPTGIMQWKQGALITAAPEIIYAADTDGDGKADKRETLYSGFLEGNQQLRVNGLRWGLDNWIYCASGAAWGSYGKGNKVKSTKTGSEIQLGSRDLRIRPEEGTIEAESGPSQFGRNPDDWGNWFGVQNSNPLWHYVLSDHYIRRNPNFATPSPRVLLVTPKNPRVYPATSQKRFHSFTHSGHYTSGCSAMIYRDELLYPRTKEQHAFTCEPFHNVVQHNVIKQSGTTFTARRDADGDTLDFFASSDRWCRPVMVRTGPDGALWVVDMYRYMIEHPDWLPKNGQDELRPFFRHGEHMGRIYRIYPKGQAPRKVPRIDEAYDDELLNLLSSPNGWIRDRVHRMLVNYKDSSIVGRLKKLVTDRPTALARLHALCILDGLNAVSDDVLQAGLKDPHPAVRRHTIRIAESSPSAAGMVTDLTSDEDPTVRLQLALSLGNFSARRAANALGSILLESTDDAYISAAAITSLNTDNIKIILDRVLTDASSNEDLIATLLHQGVAINGVDAARHASRLINRSISRKPFPVQWRLRAALLDAASKLSPQDYTTLFDQPMIQSLRMAQTAVFDTTADDASRVAAISLIARMPNADHDETDLAKLLSPTTALPVQNAAIDRMCQIASDRTPELLLASWSRHGPSIRARIVNELLTRTDWTLSLLDAIESNQVTVRSLDATTRQRLTKSKHASIRKRAAALIAQASAADEDREKAIQSFSEALTLTPDLANGKVVFTRLCAVCHKVGDVGIEIGPSLLALTDKRPESLLASIIAPNRAVDPRYTNYIATTTDGKTYAGMIIAETGTHITLIGIDGVNRNILRRELQTLADTGLSLMPPGLEASLTRQEMADLIGFVAKKK